MSFQVYLQIFHGGMPAGISLPSIRAAFPGLLLELEEDYWQLNYAPEESSDLFLQFLPGNEEQVHTISFDRLAKDMRLWNGIFRLLENDGAIFHFPGMEAPLARAEVSSDLGKPVIVLGAMEIVRLVGAT